MANRILRDWTQSENVDLLSDKAEVFFTRLIMKADDYGCYYGNTKLLKSHLYPLKNVSEATISTLIKECVKANLIVFYKADGKEYLKIINFGQRLRTMNSKFPQPIENKEVKENDSNPLPIDSNKPLETEVETEVETEAKFDFKKSLLSMSANPKLVDEWLLVRKTKKAVNTETALNSFVSELNKSKMTIDQVLTICVQKSWSGFNCEWVKDSHINADYRSCYTDDERKQIRQLVNAGFGVPKFVKQEHIQLIYDKGI
jgi:hypothetical protein